MRAVVIENRPVVELPAGIRRTSSLIAARIGTGTCRPAAIIARLADNAKPPRRRAFAWAWVWALSALLGAPLPALAAADTAAIGAALTRQLADAAPALQALYAARDRRPIWVERTTLEALATAVAALDADGLDPVHYGVPGLQAAWQNEVAETTDPARNAAFDLRASRSWLDALRDLQRGRAAPPEPPLALDIPGLAADLDAAALARSLQQSLEHARPTQPLYRHLREGLERYRDLARAGGWAALPGGPSLHPGDRDERVPLLRERLAREQTAATEPDSDPLWFDPALEAAVRTFQRDHGLHADGIVGGHTRAALNVSVAARVAQLRANLERARWLLTDLPETHVLVDIAAGDLSFVRDGALRWRTRVIVGRPSRPTPVLRSALSHLKFNPAWTIPPTILREDVLPRLRRDPDYLAREGIEVLSPAGAPLDRNAAQTLGLGEFLLRQRSGPHNPLGRVVIRFPNRYQVYLHDTPAQELFTLDERALSSGCVRVENALELVRLLLDDEHNWSRAAVVAAAESDITRSIDLPQPVPLLLWYRTARAEEDGRLTFLPDIYQRDAQVLTALDQPLRR